jgi:hypothetical protein
LEVLGLTDIISGSQYITFFFNNNEHGTKGRNSDDIITIQEEPYCPFRVQNAGCLQQCQHGWTHSIKLQGKY